MDNAKLVLYGKSDKKWIGLELNLTEKKMSTLVKAVSNISEELEAFMQAEDLNYEDIIRAAEKVAKGVK